MKQWFHLLNPLFGVNKPYSKEKTKQMINYYDHKDIQKLLSKYHNQDFDKTYISTFAINGLISRAINQILGEIYIRIGLSIYILYKSNRPTLPIKSRHFY